MHFTERTSEPVKLGTDDYELNRLCLRWLCNMPLRYESIYEEKTSREMMHLILLKSDGYADREILVGGGSFQTTCHATDKCSQLHAT